MLGDAPSRSLAELARRLGVAEAEATALVVPTTEPPTPAELSAPTPVFPLLAMMAPNDASHAPQPADAVPSLSQGQNRVRPTDGERGAVRHEAYRCNGQWSRSPFQVGDVPLGRSGQERFPDGERAAPKRSGEVRDRPPRRQAWQSDSMVSLNELGFDLRESSPLPHNNLSTVMQLKIPGFFWT
jgi:hypothetical protein